MYPLTIFLCEEYLQLSSRQKNQYPEVGVMTPDLPTGTKAQKKQ